jgi:hypothetical protein
MARGTMHAGKPDDQRRRRNKPTHETNVYTDDGTVYGPTLEELTGQTWSAPVEIWFEDWRRMPQARDFLRTDWRRLAMIAPLVQKMQDSPGAAAMSEIRMNEERLGATVVDRMRARMAITRDDDDGEGGTVLTLVEDGESDEDILGDL